MRRARDTSPNNRNVRARDVRTNTTVNPRTIVNLNNAPTPREVELENTLPTYEIDTTSGNGNLHTVTARPITTGGNNYSLLAAQLRLADLLRIYTRDRVAAQTGWTARQASTRIRGFIQITNQKNPQVNRSYNFDHLSEITQTRIDEIFEQFHTSETETPFENLEWSVVIDPHSFGHGAGLDLVKLKNSKRRELSWENHSDDQGHINCAAIALTILTSRTRFSVHPHLLRKQARELQTLLNWGDTVSIAQLEDFVKLNPKYRLTCLTPVERDFQRNTFYGSEFVDENISGTTNVNKNPFIIYVYFDYQQRHFAAEKAPAATFNALYNSQNYRFCHRCIKTFLNTEHKCDEEVTRKKHGFVRKVKCEHCLKDFPPNTHNCQDFKCTNCEALVPKILKNHRCAVMTHEVENKGYWDGVSKPEKHKPGLWVYDFESAMERVTVPYFVLEDFATDEDDKLLPIGHVNLLIERPRSNQVLKHNVNLIVLRNVISKETFVFKGYDTGNPIKEMLDLLINLNHGNHIALAHNGSGYDTRLIYNYVVQDRRELSISSINNGTKFLELSIKSPKPG